MSDRWEAHISENDPGDGFAYTVVLVRNGRTMTTTYADTRLGARWRAWRLKRQWLRREGKERGRWVSRV